MEVADAIWEGYGGKLSFIVTVNNDFFRSIWKRWCMFDMNCTIVLLCCYWKLLTIIVISLANQRSQSSVKIELFSFSPLHLPLGIGPYWAADAR